MKIALLDLFQEQLNPKRFDLNRCLRHYALWLVFSFLSTPVTYIGIILGVFGLFGCVMENYAERNDIDMVRAGWYALLWMLISATVFIYVGTAMKRKEFGGALLATAQDWWHLKRVVRKYGVELKKASDADGVAAAFKSRLLKIASEVQRLEHEQFTKSRNKLREEFSRFYCEVKSLRFSVTEERSFFDGLDKASVNVNRRVYTAL